MSNLDLRDLRRQYGRSRIANLPEEPMTLFKRWFEEQLQVEPDDPNAMILSTVDDLGFPQSRVVLLKGIEEGAFVFYTNYASAKAQQMANQPKVGLLFYWPKLARQVRVSGQIQKVSDAVSDAYFASRPRASQIAAHASMQSECIADTAVLEERYQQIEIQYQGKDIPRPEYWGGYAVLPERFEFWQGKDNRMHERVLYMPDGAGWQRNRLAP